MSTNGAGKCCLTLNSSFIAAIGVGLLVGDGVVIGVEELAKQIEKTLDARQKADSEQYDKMLKQQQSIKNQVDNLSSQIEALATARLYRGSVPSRRIDKAQQQKLAQTIQQARVAVTEARVERESLEEVERERLQQSLRRELIAGRILLPAELVQEAEEALEDSNETMVRVVYRLQVARQEVEAALSEQERQRRQVEEMIDFTLTQLQVVEQMLQEMRSEHQAVFIERRRAIQKALKSIDLSEQDHVEESVEQAVQAHQSARTLINAVSTALLEAWSEVNRQVNRQIGMLQQLRTMVDEVGRVNVTDRRVLHALTNRLSDVHSALESLSQYSLRDAQRHLSELIEETLIFKEDVFTVIEKFKQRAVAETIASTLMDLAYRPQASDQRLIRENGDVTRVVATLGGNASQAKRDDRIVSFDISRDGTVVYDFVGYTGDACVEAAEQILAALREKGLYILDTKVVDQLQATTAKGQRITPEMLDKPEFQHHPVKNKMQAELAERIHAVLERMNYNTIMEQVVGGCIEMEAFNGPVGYRVVLTPEGSMQVYKDAEMNEIDVAFDKEDPVVAEALQVREQQKYEEEQQPSEKRRKSLPYRRKQNLQEY